MGILTARLFAWQSLAGCVSRLVAIIAFGALLRPYWWAAMTNHDFNFDHEPEIEFILAFFQFAVAAISFLVPRGTRGSAA